MLRAVTSATFVYSTVESRSFLGIMIGDRWEMKDCGDSHVAQIMVPQIGTPNLPIAM